MRTCVCVCVCLQEFVRSPTWLPHAQYIIKEGYDLDLFTEDAVLSWATIRTDTDVEADRVVVVAVRMPRVLCALCVYTHVCVCVHARVCVCVCECISFAHVIAVFQVLGVASGS